MRRTPTHVSQAVFYLADRVERRFKAVPRIVAQTRAITGFVCAVRLGAQSNHFPDTLLDAPWLRERVVDTQTTNSDSYKTWRDASF